MDVSVCVATFGDASWKVRAEDAIRSVPAGIPVYRAHRDTLHDARNAAMKHVETEWLCFLDADDTLEDGYFDVMATGSADVRAPLVRQVRPNGRERGLWHPRVWGHEHTCTAECLRSGNWVVIGAVVRTEIAKRCVWNDFEWSEDWDFWLQAWERGATFELIPDAIYRAEYRPDSRNHGQSASAREAAHRAIHAAHFG